jgi:tetratricopeptide (TPR) repeat protein
VIFFLQRSDVFLCSGLSYPANSADVNMNSTASSKVLSSKARAFKQSASVCREMEALLREARAALNLSPTDAQTLSERLIALADRAQSPVHHIWGVLIRGSAQFYLGNPAAAMRDVTNAQAFFEKEKHLAGLAESARILGYIDYVTGRFKSAQEHFLRSQSFAKKNIDPTADALAQLGVASVYMALGDFGKAAEMFTDLESQATLRSNHAFHQMVLSNLGSLYVELHDDSRAILYYRKALTLARETKNRRNEAAILSNIGRAARRAKKYTDAIRYTKESIALLKTMGDYMHLGTVLQELALEYRFTRQFSKAITVLNEAIEVYQKINNPNGVAHIYETLGSLKHEMKKPKESLVFLKKALAGSATGTKKLKHDIHLAFALTLESLNDKAAAFDHLQTAYTLYQELYQEETAAKTAKLAVLHEVRAAEEENARLRRDLEFKQQELTSLAMSLVQKNEVITKLRGSETDKPLASAEKDWAAFEKQFNLLHQGFIKDLSVKFPSLTPTELRICALLKIHLNTKDIAKLLFISPRTVDVHRYRIHKKLDLAEKQNLVQFLTAL